MQGARDGHCSVACGAEEGVENYIGAACAVAVGEVGCEEDGKEGEEVGRSGESLGA